MIVVMYSDKIPDSRYRIGHHWDDGSACTCIVQVADKAMMLNEILHREGVEMGTFVVIKLGVVWHFSSSKPVRGWRNSVSVSDK